MSWAWATTHLSGDRKRRAHTHAVDLDRNAGFQSATPARLYFPVIMDPIYGYQVVNVESAAQRPVQPSALDAEHDCAAQTVQVFGRGTLDVLEPGEPEVLAYLRNLDRGDGSSETVLCVANLSRFAQPASLDCRDTGNEPGEIAGLCAVSNYHGCSLLRWRWRLTRFLWLNCSPLIRSRNSFGQRSWKLAKSHRTRRCRPESTQPGLRRDCLAPTAWTVGRHAARLAEAERWFGAKSRTINRPCPGLGRASLRKLPRSAPVRMERDGRSHGDSAGAFLREIAYDGSPADVLPASARIQHRSRGRRDCIERSASVLTTMAFRWYSGLHDAIHQGRRSPVFAGVD